MLHEITLDLLEFSILVSSGAVIYPEPVEARGYLASFLVEINNPSDQCISCCVNIVQVAYTNQDIQAMGNPGRVVGHTGGAFEWQVLLLILNPLQDPDLARTIVPVADLSSGGSCRCHSGGQHSV